MMRTITVHTSTGKGTTKSFINSTPLKYLGPMMNVMLNTASVDNAGIFQQILSSLL